jgi:hypothetical protein
MPTSESKITRIKNHKIYTHYSTISKQNRSFLIYTEYTKPSGSHYERKDKKTKAKEE